MISNESSGVFVVLSDWDVYRILEELCAMVSCTHLIFSQPFCMFRSNTEICSILVKYVIYTW